MSAEPIEYLHQDKIGESDDHNQNIDISPPANYRTNPDSKKRRIRVGIDVGGPRSPKQLQSIWSQGVF